MRRFVHLVSSPVPAGILATVVGGVILLFFAAWLGKDPLGWLGAVLGWLRPIPMWPWVLAIGVVVGVVGTMGLARVRRVRLKKSWPLVLGGRSSLYGWRHFGLEYGGVEWRFRIPLPGPLSASDLSAYTVEELSVDVPPRCPTCKTELEERTTLWGMYRWHCIGCRFQIRQRASFYQVAGQVEKIGRRHLEELIFKQRTG